jgi:hypothetical protein
MIFFTYKIFFLKNYGTDSQKYPDANMSVIWDLRKYPAVKSCWHSTHRHQKTLHTLKYPVDKHQNVLLPIKSGIQTKNSLTHLYSTCFLNNKNSPDRRSTKISQQLPGSILTHHRRSKKQLPTWSWKPCKTCRGYRVTPPMPKIP